MKRDIPDFDWFLKRLAEIQSGLKLENKLVREATEIIWNRIDCSLNVNSIVTMMPTTRRTLERYFRSEIGLTISEVIAIARLELTKWLLTETSYPIHLVAERAGYASSDWMGKVIRRSTGMTPNDYRHYSKKR